MEDQKLKQLIADSIEQIEAEERERKVLAEAEKIEYENLMITATRDALLRVKDLPYPLLPYCYAAQGPGHWDHAGNIEQLKKGWLPEKFIINAPGLVAISFGTAKVDRDYGVITGISFNGFGGTTSNWTKAIAEAARRFQEREENVQRAESFEFQKAAGVVHSENRPKDERLVDLIRELAKELRGFE